MLQITLVMEDKISLDDLQEEIAEFEDYVQSTDVAGMSRTLLPLDSSLPYSYAKALEERSRLFCMGLEDECIFAITPHPGTSFQLYPASLLIPSHSLLWS
jgi:hypothetical protein